MGVVGTDPVVSKDRFTFGFDFLMDGVGLIPVVMGLFGISEVLLNLEKQEFSLFVGKIKNLFPNLEDWKASKWPIIRGTVIGFFYGILPGGNAIISSIISYGVEKRVSKHPERFGQGAIEGVAGPESANNATATSAFIPLLTLGNPNQCGHGHRPGGPHDSRSRPGSPPHHKEPGYFLGCHCEHVCRAMSSSLP